MESTRRQFIVGCSAAIAALAGARTSAFAFSDGRAAATDKILVVIFLRGGIDALNLVAPVDDKNYIAARPTYLRLLDQKQGDQLPGLALNNGYAGAGDFRMHPGAAPLHELYQSGKLALVHGCGLKNGTRSHFEAMDLIERGIAENQQMPIGNGWIARYLKETGAKGFIPAAAMDGALPASMIGSSSSMALPNLEAFTFYGDGEQEKALRAAYGGTSPLEVAGSTAWKALDAVRSKLPKKPDGGIAPYQPREGVKYPDMGLANQLKNLAQLIKMDVGLTVATVDYGGWDTHQDQAYNFYARTNELSQSLAAFYNDLAPIHDRLSVVVMSEFGRRLKSNESGGTDHGYGGMLMVLGGSVRGGRMLGKWPGLANEQLDQGADLGITTDYRSVLSEVLQSSLGLQNPGVIFPGFASKDRLGLYG